MASKKITRNEFLKKGLSLGLAVGGSTILGRTDELFARGNMKEIPDLVAVKNAEPDVMFRKAINMMGGMSQYVKKGQTVVVKPNIVIAMKPEFAATTNPLLVKTIIEECYRAGAKKVYVFDNNAADSAAYCYKISDIEEAATSAGAQIMYADSPDYYKEMKMPSTAKALTSTTVHKLILDSDVIINVPILKTHLATGITSAMKNLMGAVLDRQAYHFGGLDQSIADFCLYCKPTLNIVDAYRTGTNPVGTVSTPIKRQTLLISRDIVAVDSAASKIIGHHANHIDIGHSMKIGNKKLDELKIARFAF